MLGTAILTFPAFPVKTMEEKELVSLSIDQPRWDQRTFFGRLQHFARITNPLLLLASSKRLEEAATIVQSAREGRLPQGYPKNKLWKAKTLYDSAFHPDTGERMVFLGRMSAQMPAGMVITGGMLAFYKTPIEVVTAQWVNQSFNALVNYTNRNAKSDITNKQILQAYVGATTCATAVAVGLNSLVKRAPSIVARWVPFVAVASANCVNIPLMRQREIANGVVVTDREGNRLGISKRAAVTGITQVCISRILMAAPGMILGPIIMEQLEKKPIFNRGRIFSATLQTLICGITLTFMVPIACSIFPQLSSIKGERLEPQVKREIIAQYGFIPDQVYFNKGL